MMRIFIKDINLDQIHYILKYPIQGLVFSINQKNAEEIRDIINEIPFYLTILGELHTDLKYEIEELIFFCKLKGIILTESKTQDEYSCPRISLETTPYNAFILENGKNITCNVDLNQLEYYTNLESLILSIDEFRKYWPQILKIWTENKVV